MSKQIIPGISLSLVTRYLLHLEYYYVSIIVEINLFIHEPQHASYRVNINILKLQLRQLLMALT